MKDHPGCVPLASCDNAHVLVFGVIGIRLTEVWGVRLFVEAMLGQ